MHTIDMHSARPAADTATNVSTTTRTQRQLSQQKEIVVEIDVVLRQIAVIMWSEFTVNRQECHKRVDL